MNCAPRTRTFAWRICIAFLLAHPWVPALAQEVPPGLGSDSLQFTAFERSAANANQSVYELLTTGPAGCTDQQTGASGACSGRVFDVFSDVRELVHTANELNGSGPTTFGLGLDNEGLGFALRWTAGEELAAQGSSIRQFTNSQLGTLASRISALRLGAVGLRTASLGWSTDTLVAANEPVASGNDSIARRWSAFLDGSFGYGDKDDTTFGGGFENAFDFDSQEVSLGADYRINDQVIGGVLLGYTDKEVDFDSSASVVDGRIKSDGASLLAYGLWEGDLLYFTGSLGGQWLSHDLTRRITYPSFNPLLPATDETAEGDTDSTALLGTLGTGATFRWGSFAAEPYFNAEYQDIEIDAFTESRAFGFDLAYDSQDIESFELSLGLRLQYVLTPSFGIVVPYVRTEWRRELEDDARIIRARYLGLAELQSVLPLDADFAVPTDEVDDAYAVYAGGFSMVLPNGLQGFLQFQSVSGLDDYSENVITGGVRLEF